VKIVKLGEVVELFNGSTPLKTNKNYWVNGDVPWFTVDDMRKQGKYITYTEKFITKLGLKESSISLIPENAVLLCCTASVGAIAINKIRLTTNQQFNALVVKNPEQLSVEYLYYWFLANMDTLKSLGRATTIDYVSMSKLRDMGLQLPSLEKQKEIVEKLDSAFTYLDLLDAKQKESVIHVSTMLESYIDELLLRNHDVKVPLTNFATIENGDRGSNYPNKRMREESGIPFINAGHIGEGKLDMSQMDYISRSTFNKLSRGKIKRNDLLFCLRGSLGKTALLSDIDEGAIASSLVIVRAKDEVNPKFLLYYFLSSICKAQIEEFRSGTAQPNLGGADLKKFLVPEHSVSQMQEIVKKIDEIDSQIKTLIKNIDSRTIALSELRQSLLSKAFSQEEAVG
jgi:restriction endonuclease S subunit